MTLIATTILIFIASGMSDRATVVASVMVGAAACVAMSQATDLMLDLKTGYLVGATPRKQQIAQFLGTWLGPILIMGLIVELHQDSPLGGDKYTAPQDDELDQLQELEDMRAAAREKHMGPEFTVPLADVGRYLGSAR